MKRTEPTQRLFDPNKSTQLKYVPHDKQDVKATFARFVTKPVNIQPLKRKA